MKLRNGAQWSLVVPTSMGVRLTPDSGQTVHSSDRFRLQATSAETNVASVAAYLGLPVKVLTNFVADSPISALIKANLRARGMAFEGPDAPQGGAWGYRHQFNIADSGYGLRGPRVWNDRAGEVGRTLAASDFDTERLFGDEGVQILHLSGLIGALSPQTSQLCVELARAAKAHGTAISFDLNYRASFWKGREAELRAAFTQIAELSDILIGNEEDFQLALGVEGPQAGGEAVTDQLDGFVAMIDRVRERFGNASVFATTLREVVSANRHLWGAIVSDETGLCTVPPREIGVLDRIGGGDGFVGGLLYGLLRDWSLEDATHFGWASGAYAATCLTDYATPIDEAAIWSIWEGNARVVR
jgi:Sugar kinases, ribokinase family